ncbi:hypothetical protein KC640_01410, partial [Candidatus Dojkabacteria bacterium]|nr:hypothetical protein [Candidatus Dojkabacteria bacterium]
SSIVSDAEADLLKFLAVCRQKLKPQGNVVILLSAGTNFASLVERSGFSVKESYGVYVGGQAANIYKLTLIPVKGKTTTSQ